MEPEEKTPLLETHVDERSTRPAALQCCVECPYKKENFGREHPERQYTAEGITSKWRATSQDGAVFGCHMFDADLIAYDDEIQSLGYRAPADIGGRRECSGMAAMIGRELKIAARIINSEGGNYEDYQNQRPAGMSLKALQHHAHRLEGKTGPRLRLSEHVKDQDIIDPADLVDTDSPYWKMSETVAANILHALQVIEPKFRDCDCAVCTRHSEVHPERELMTVEGTTVKVDAELHPLLTMMAAAGIRTTESCIDIHEAVTTFTPGQLARLVNGADRATLNYERPLRRKAAFLRCVNKTSVEQAFIISAADAEGVETHTVGSQTQLVFDRKSIPHLVRVAKFLGTKQAGGAPKKSKKHKPIPAGSKKELAQRLLKQRQAEQ